MAIRYFNRADDNAEFFGRITVEGVPDPSTDNIDIDMGRAVQFPTISMAESYCRNPYWFGKSNIKLYHLILSSGSEYDIYQHDNVTAASVSAFGHGIVFADFRDSGVVFSGRSKTLSVNSWDFKGSVSDLFSKVLFGTTISVIDADDSKDLYLIYSEDEQINGDVFSIIKSSKSKFSDGSVTAGTSTQNWTDESPAGKPKSYYALGNIQDDWPSNTDCSIVQPMVFNDNSGVLEIISINDYALYLEEYGDIYLEFNDSLASDTDLTIVLFRADSPRVIITDETQIIAPSETFAGGVRIGQENFPYNRMDLTYRVG